MQRKNFIKKSISALGVAFVAPLAHSCGKDADLVSTGTDTAPDGTGTTANCTATPSETEGPFPTKSPSGLVKSDITGDRPGTLLTAKITVTNTSNNCAALEAAIVDVWHCDAQGNYSEYGGSGMQSTNYTSVHWLRGRQTTDANGLVTFTTIFPGWYSGRAPHIHVHIYNAAGKSLLVTQIAFPADVCNTVYTTAEAYKSRGTQDTANNRDNVFADSLASELATVSGNITSGYTLTHTIGVKG